MADEAAPTAAAGDNVGPAPVVAAPQVTPPEPVQQPGPGPWSQDLQTYFQDPTAQQAADRYVRERVQPRMTELEQQVAHLSGAQEFLSDFQQDPDNTLQALVSELYGDDRPDLVQAVTQAFQTPAVTENQPPPQQSTSEKLSLDALPDEVREMFEERQAARAADEYNEAVDGFITQHDQLSESDKQFLHPFINAAGGDLNAAAAGYLDYRQQVLAAHGVQPPAPPQAPATLGTEGTGTTPPPTARQYTQWSDLGDAMDEFIAENRSSGITPVGTV